VLGRHATGHARHPARSAPRGAGDRLRRRGAVDTVGKALNVPLHRLWGGFRDGHSGHRHGRYYRSEDDLGAVAREMEALRRQGFSGCKSRSRADAGGGCRAGPRRARWRRSRFHLMPDPNQGWSYDEALRFARPVEPFDIRWLESRAMVERPAASGRACAAPWRSRSAPGRARSPRPAVAADGRPARSTSELRSSWGGGPTEWRKSRRWRMFRHRRAVASGTAGRRHAGGLRAQRGVRRGHATGPRSALPCADRGTRRPSRTASCVCRTCRLGPGAGQEESRRSCVPRDHMERRMSLSANRHPLRRDMR